MDANDRTMDAKSSRRGAKPAADGCPDVETAGELLRNKRVLYFSPIRGRFDRFSAGVRRVRGVASARTPSGSWVTRINGADEDREVAVHWLAEHTRQGVLNQLDAQYINLLLLDLRAPSDDHDAVVGAGLDLLDTLDDTEDLEARYGFHRISVLVSGPDPAREDLLIARLGAYGIATVLRETPAERHESGEADTAFFARVVDSIRAQIAERRSGDRALCAAGGGITGIFYELGALKCLDDCLSGEGANGFDTYFGISAGAIVASILAVGYSADELMAAIAGVEGGRIPPLDLRLLRWSHLDTADLKRRLGIATRTAARVFWDVLRGRGRPTLESLLFEYGDIIGPPFHGERFELTLRQLFNAPGATNDFRRLRKPLFIGASDQDRRQHVVFGSEGYDHVPISQAIQASMSVNPAFSATPIEGRFYEDGAVTRTSNFVEAIRRGASMLFIIDPLVPYVSGEPGFARRRGVLYNVDQDIRTVSYTRFENTRNWVLRKHPEVSSYTFLPSNRLRRLLSVSPMDHRPFLPIWRGAYLSTLQRIQRLCHRMRGDLFAYGLRLDTTRAEAVADRLAATESVRFDDFFPEGRPVIKRPPLRGDKGVRPRTSR